MLSAGQGPGATSGNDNRINSLVSFGRSSLASFDRSNASASSTGATGSVQLAVSIGPLKRVGSPGKCDETSSNHTARVDKRRDDGMWPESARFGEGLVLAFAYADQML